MNMWACLPLFLFISPLISDGKEKDPTDKLERKIGQMIMVGFRGTEITPDNPLHQQIVQGQIGGVVLFDFDSITQSNKRNIESPEQLKKLTSFLQKDTLKPLLIAVDQEGGRVMRLKPERGFAGSLSADQLGKFNRLSITRGCSEAMASTLKGVGINLNFAPVVDLDFIQNPIIGQKERSFSENPHIVIQHAREMIQAHHRHGMLTTLKHFPGMGSATEDTHNGFVDTTNQWDEKELSPFSSLIQLGEVDLIMIGHTVNRSIDEEYPASLSEKTVQGLLRDRLHFQGVVITDDLQMGAIAKEYDLQTVVQRAILAGNDILLFANQQGTYDEEIAPKVIAIVKELVEQGIIPRKRIQKSADRIHTLKRSLSRGTRARSTPIL